MAVRAIALAAVAALAGGCLGPQVGDEVEPPDHILPAGSTVPSIYDDAALARRIADNDGVGATVPLLGGFAAGQPVRYWDFGPAPTFGSPVFSLRRRNTEGQLVKIDHPPIFEHIPGDPGYSPFWALFAVEVTETYAGQVLPSVAALQQAQEEGLVKSPRLMPINVNCPIVARNVAVEGAAGRKGTFYWNGLAGDYYDFGETALPDAAHVPTVDLYVLHRQGEEPLSEPVRGVDINGDGDRADSNNVFARPGTDPLFSPLCQEVEVTVTSDVGSIDDLATPDIRAASQLFVDGVPVAPPVVAYRTGARRFNCPIQPGGGG